MIYGRERKVQLIMFTYLNLQYRSQRSLIWPILLLLTPLRTYTDPREGGSSLGRDRLKLNQQGRLF